MNRQPLAVELLVSPDARRARVTVADHSAFRQSTTLAAPDPWDEIDELVADAEQALQSRSQREANRVLRILDDLAVEKLRSQNFEERGAE